MRGEVAFWASIVAIVLLGTIGSLLYKHGTNKLGVITFERLLEIELNGMSITYAILLVAGVLLFILAGLGLREFSFMANYIFSPAIFTALVILAFSRFLIGIPLSVAGLGRLQAFLTSIGVVATAVASLIAFKESYSPRVILGIALATLGILLIGQEF